MRQRKAFTLIELLVVIAIIALLISILLPSLQQAKNLAKSMICKTHLKGIGNAMVLYSEENKGLVANTYPYGEVTETGGSGVTWPTWPHVMVAFSQRTWEEDPDYNPSSSDSRAWVPSIRYIDEPDILFCPLDATEPDEWAQQVNGSYGINTTMFLGDAPGDPPSDGANFYNIQGSLRADQMYLLFCNLNDGGPDFHDQSNADVTDLIGFVADKIGAWTVALRHGNSFDSTHMLDHTGAVSEMHWKDIRTSVGGAVYDSTTTEWRFKGPWGNGLGLTELHNIPDGEYNTIMKLPGN